MKKLSKILSAISIITVILSLCACGGKQTKTLIYGNTDLSKYVTLGKYKGLSVDTKSDEYEAALQSVYQTDVSSNNIFEKKTKGTVQNGDVANIDYEGKKDGVAFDGGTAQGYDLTIGSNTFIPGFEDGLIGVNIGDTVDLSLTFPENYGSAELAGKAVVFTVKVNYVKSTDEVDVKEHYSELGFGSEKEYVKDAEKRATQQLLSDTLISSSEIIDYPEKDREIFVNAVYDFYDSHYQKNYNASFEDMLSSQYNMTVDDFKTEMNAASDEQTKDKMVYYAVLQKEGLKADYDLPESRKSGQSVLDEMEKVEYVVKDFLYDNAKIK
ncbi:MAG: FKBP-type peptidyl-prolyl cis-trans isomerase [Clostridia bacterium]|nr:FKBP-type peptidyl-prolyl cis-trans isomerase [Clostridia bacterium]